MKRIVLSLSLLLVFLFSACSETAFLDSSSENAFSDISSSVSKENSSETNNDSSEEDESSYVSSEKETENDFVFSIANIPAYSGNPYVILNSNKPTFKASEITTTAFEKYDSLDSLGRCTKTLASVGKEIMPTEDRGSIGQVKPTGWHTVKYDNVDGKYLYNRCHLIGFQLTGENANTKNLITGTRYLNVDGMLPFENMVADYVKETGNHVMYRVIPVYVGNNLLASGVHMEGYSVEDSGEGISFNVYCYNVQPGINIDYKTGESSLATTENSKPTENSQPQKTENYTLNTNSKKIHYPSCSYAKKIAEKNKKEVTESLDSLISDGYTKCGHCFK